jgi:hypothetical protein
MQANFLKQRMEETTAAVLKLISLVGLPFVLLK